MDQNRPGVDGCEKTQEEVFVNREDVDEEMIRDGVEISITDEQKRGEEDVSARCFCASYDLSLGRTEGGRREMRKVWELERERGHGSV